MFAGSSTDGICNTARNKQGLQPHSPTPLTIPDNPKANRRRPPLLHRLHRPSQQRAGGDCKERRLHWCCGMVTSAGELDCYAIVHCGLGRALTGDQILGE